MSQKIFGIYRLTFPNNKVYIGKGTNLYKRFNEYSRCKNYDYQDLVVHRAIKKYGWENIKKDILIGEVYLTDTQLNGYEKFWIKVYNSTNKDIGYNVSSGGESTTGLKGELSKRFGTIQSDIAKSKISLKMKGWWDNHPEQKIKHKSILANNKYKVGKPTSVKQKEAVKKACSKPIYQCNKNTTEIIKEWESVREAAKYFQCAENYISRVLDGKVSNRHRNAKGFTWYSKKYYKNEM